MDESSGGRKGSGLHYRLVVEGRLGPEWREWFGAAAVQADEETTRIDVRVRDQAELHGLLRRVHDLHLPLLSLTLATPSATLRDDRERNQKGTHDE